MALVMIASSTKAVSAGIRAGARLTTTEEERASNYLSARAFANFVGGHLLARVCVAERLGVPPRRVVLEQHCAECGGPHGRPSVQGFEAVSVSISHSGGLVGVAATQDPEGVGIDVESVEPGGRSLSPAARRHAMSDREQSAIEGALDPYQEFLKLWVRKEALIKVGLADLDRMSQVDVHGDGVSVGKHRLFDLEGRDYVGAIASAMTPTCRWL